MAIKLHRLRKTPDFTKTYSQGKRHYLGGVLLFYIPNAQPYTRIACVVGKKFSPLAVNRNKQRRIMQHAVQNYVPFLLPGYDIVLSYTNRGNMLPYKEACVILKKIFTRAQLFIE